MKIKWIFSFRNITTIILSVLLVFVSLSGILACVNYFSSQKPRNFQVSAWDGNGSYDSPYQIKTAEDLNTLSKNVADGEEYYQKYFKLMNDLDYEGQSFIPIGAKLNQGAYVGNEPFCGFFDGDYHTISNIKINITSATTSPELGLFSSISMVGTGNILDKKNEQIDLSVKNLKIKKFQITLSNTVQYGAFIGAVVGDACSFSTTGSTDQDQRYARVKIENCIVEDFSVSSSVAVNVGGFVGLNQTLYGTNYANYAPLVIKHCLIKNFNISGQSSNSIISVLGPAYGNVARSDVGFDKFAYVYDISFCITDNNSYPTVLGFAEYLDYEFGREIGRDVILEQPARYNGDTAGLYENEKIERIYNDLEEATDDFYMYGYAGDVLSYYSDQCRWYRSYGDGWPYLKRFLTEVTFKTNSPELGTISQKFDGMYSDTPGLEEATAVVPKDEIADINDVSLRIFNVTFTATANPGYEFIKWEQVDNEYVAIFEMNSTTITFEKADFTDFNQDVSYSVSKGTQVYVNFTTTLLKNGAYTSCTFTFVEKDKTANTIVTYNIASNTKFISKFKMNNTEYSNSMNFNISDETTFTVICATKTYDSLFQ